MNVNRKVSRNPSDSKGVRHQFAAAMLVCSALLRAQALSPQEASIARQRAAIEAQKAALSAPSGTLVKQQTSVDKQKASAAHQPALRSEPLQPPVVAGDGPSASLDCPPLPEGQLGPIVDKAAEDNALMPALLRAVIGQESGFRPCAVSRAGAQGLMQLMPETAAGLNVSNPFDPQQNVFAGSKFLRLLLDRYNGDLPKALGAYNAGPARVDAVGGIPPIPETQNYVNSIMRKIQ